MIEASEGPARSNPYASLRWHYPDQVQRVFLTRAHSRIDGCNNTTQDPRVSTAEDTTGRRAWQPGEIRACEPFAPRHCAQAPARRAKHVTGP